MKNECGLKWMWSQMNVVSNECGLKWMWSQINRSQINVVSSECGLKWIWAQMNVVSNECGLKWMWSQMNVFSNEQVSYECGLKWAGLKCRGLKRKWSPMKLSQMNWSQLSAHHAVQYKGSEMGGNIYLNGNKIINSNPNPPSGSERVQQQLIESLFLSRNGRSSTMSGCLNMDGNKLTTKWSCSNKRIWATHTKFSLRGGNMQRGIGMFRNRISHFRAPEQVNDAVHLSFANEYFLKHMGQIGWDITFVLVGSECWKFSRTPTCC